MLGYHRNTEGDTIEISPDLSNLDDIISANVIEFCYSEKYKIVYYHLDNKFVLFMTWLNKTGNPYYPEKYKLCDIMYQSEDKYLKFKEAYQVQQTNVPITIKDKLNIVECELHSINFNEFVLT